MKMVSVIFCIFFLCLFLCPAGCGPVPAAGYDGPDDFSIYTRYGPVELDVMPLTEFVGVGDGEPSKIRVYVSLLDGFGHQQKWPGVFRFELYEKIARSVEPKGRRIVIWPDVDLTEPAENDRYWQDFLRSYKFDLDFEPAAGQNYILQISWLCPGGRRLLAEFKLKNAK